MANLFKLLRRRDSIQTADVTRTTVLPHDDVVDMQSQPRERFSEFMVTVIDAQPLDAKVADGSAVDNQPQAPSQPQAQTTRGLSAEAPVEPGADALARPIDPPQAQAPAAVEPRAVFETTFTSARLSDVTFTADAVEDARLVTHEPANETPPAAAAPAPAEPSAEPPALADALPAAAAAEPNPAAAKAHAPTSTPPDAAVAAPARASEGTAGLIKPKRSSRSRPTVSHEIVPRPSREVADAVLAKLREPKAEAAPLVPAPVDAAAARREPDRVPIDEADQPDFAQTMLLGDNERLMGDLLRQTRNLSVEQVEAIVQHQRKHRMRFGESAVALGYVKSSDVLWALSKQYGYDYAPATTVGSDEFSDDLVIAKHPFSRAAETIRDLRSTLLAGVLNPDDTPRRALALVSPNRGDGKSWFAANLAVSLSQLGSRTLLIDANLRNPRLHTIFGVDKPRSGLTGILSRGHKADVLRPLRELPNLYLLPAGVVPPNPLEILQGRGFVDLLIKLRMKFTHVIVDTPALDHGADARLVAARCGASVLVARKHHSSLPVLQETARNLAKGDAVFAGLLINEI